MDRYKKICVDKNIDPKKTCLELLTKAVEGPRKNKLIDYPRIRVFDVIVEQNSE